MHMTPVTLPGGCHPRYLCFYAMHLKFLLRVLVARGKARQLFLHKLPAAQVFSHRGSQLMCAAVTGCFPAPDADCQGPQSYCSYFVLGAVWCRMPYLLATAQSSM
jgi:hypothetical protein